MYKRYILLALACLVLHVSAFECENEGFFCSNCVTSHECVLEDGVYNETSIRCPAGETCNQNTGQCMTNPNPQCHGIPYRFTCNQPGVFPHPLDCTRYAMCSNDAEGELIITPIDVFCKPGMAYDASTKMCTKQLDGVCNFIISSSCERVGTEGAVLDNDRMYFYCLNTMISGESFLTPQLFYCNNGFKYINNICRDPTPPSIPLEGGRCTSDGDIYDPNNCRRFFRCIKDEIPVRMDCEPDEHFDGWKQTCLSYECPY